MFRFFLSGAFFSSNDSLKPWLDISFLFAVSFYHLYCCLSLECLTSHSTHTRHMDCDAVYMEQKNWWKIISEEMRRLNLLQSAKNLSISLSFSLFNRIFFLFTSTLVVFAENIFYRVFRMWASLLAAFTAKTKEEGRNWNILNFQQGIQPVSVHFYYILLKFAWLFFW